MPFAWLWCLLADALVEPGLAVQRGGRVHGVQSSSPSVLTRSNVLVAAVRVAALVPLGLLAAPAPPATIPAESDLFKAIMEPSPSDGSPKDHAPVVRPKPSPPASAPPAGGAPQQQPVQERRPDDITRS